MGRAFEGYDYVVTPSGSCVAMVRDNYPRIAAKGTDPRLTRVSDSLVPRTYELTEFLVDVLGVTDVGAYFPHKVTYHPRATACACWAWATGRRNSSMRSRGLN